MFKTSIVAAAVVAIAGSANAQTFSSGQFDLSNLASTQITFDLSGLEGDTFTGYELEIDWGLVNGRERPNDATEIDFVITSDSGASLFDIDAEPVFEYENYNPVANFGTDPRLLFSGDFAAPFTVGASDELLVDITNNEALGLFENGNWNNLDFTVTLVPAPGAAAFLGLAGLAAVRRRR